MLTLPLVLTLTFAADVDVFPQDDLWAALGSAAAGDTITVHAGTYQTPGFVELNLQGTQNAPIVIQAAAGEVVVIQGVSNQNTLNITGSYYTFRGFEITVGSHGLRIGDTAHALFEDLHIHDVNDVGFSCNRPDNTYEDLTVRRVHIHHTGQNGGPGECMYLGCNDNACQMWDSVIEWNWCHDTLAGAQGDGIELKTGSYNTVVRHNVIHDVKYPGITMYGTVGNKPANVVDGNVIWNVQDNGIQTVGDVIVRNNIVMNVGASGIAAKPSQGEIVENMTIAHNTVMGAGDACLRVNELDAGGNNVIANNALYCANSAAIKFPNGTGAAIVAGNAVVGSVNGPNAGTFDGVDPSAAFLDAPGMDFYPVDGGPLVDAGDAGQTVAQDFNCLDREPSAPEVGAYDWSTAQNPGWEVQPGFKECAGDPSGTDTDGTDTDPTTDTDDPSTSSDTDDPTITATDTDDPTTSSGTETGDTTAGTSGSGTNGATDTGVTGTGGSDSGDSSGGTTAGTDTGSDETGDEGCGCVASDRGESALAGLLLVLGLGLSRTRRRA